MTLKEFVKSMNGQKKMKPVRTGDVIADWVESLNSWTPEELAAEAFNQDIVDYNVSDFPNVVKEICEILRNP